MFGLNKKGQTHEMNHDFSYIPENVFYFDSACQTMRPFEVIAAEEEYYMKYNACGHRVKYKWGEKVDDKVEETRDKLLKFVKKSKDDYTVAFTLNTTYGINLILSQLGEDKYESIVTSDIEHNSVFLPTMTFAKRAGINRVVLDRAEDGSLIYNKTDLRRSVVVLNSTSNIDARNLLNVKKLADDIHDEGGILILDAAQTMGHSPELLHGVDFDAICTSGHKMYGPSLGIIIIKKSLIKQLKPTWIGGGTVSDVQKETFVLIDDEEEMFSRLETGLQDFAAIIGLNETLHWIDSFKPEGKHAADHTKELQTMVFENLSYIPGLHILGGPDGGTFSMYHDGIDSHTLALYASEQNIMMRSGYFCCHYYLKNKLKLPPLLRLSLGLHNTKAEVEFVLTTLERLFKTR